MRMATDLSVRLGLVAPAVLERLHHLLQRAGLPLRAPALGAASYLEWMGRDKKTEAGQIRFVVLEALGRAVVRPAPDDMVARVVEDAALV
jgi:3-dehydroquinate synthase